MAYKEQKLICHSSGGWKSKIRVPARSGSDGHPLQVADDRLLAGGRSQKILSADDLASYFLLRK